MVRKLVAFALYQPLFLVLVTLLFIGAGIVAFRSLPVEAFPDVTDIQATVITLVPGHAAEEVEKQVTIPLEIVLAGVPHAVRMFSHTQFGLSFLTITFDDQVDDYFARQRVLERLQQAELPPDIQPQLAPLSTPVGELYRFRLVSRPRESDRAAQHRGLGRRASAEDGARRGRRGQPRRVHQAVSGEPRPRPHEGLRRHDCSRSSPRSVAAT